MSIISVRDNENNRWKINAKKKKKRKKERKKGKKEQRVRKLLKKGKRWNDFVECLSQIFSN